MVQSDSSNSWLRVSEALLRVIKPEEAGIEIFGVGMDEAEFASLVDRETERVDDTLVAMSAAQGREGVRSIFDGLSNDTVIALFSRWAHFHGSWERLAGNGDFDPWVPPKEKDIWRAVLLSMCLDRPAAEDAHTRLWGEES